MSIEVAGDSAKRKRRYIFGKAIDFIEMAERGDDIMKTGKLRANASDSLKNYGWFTRAISLSSSRFRGAEAEGFSDELKELRNTLTNLVEGKTVPPEKIDEVKKLFSFLREIALAIDTSPTDRITVK